MTTINAAHSTALSYMYDSVLEAMPIDPTGILAFRMPAWLQKRLSKLLEKNAAGKLAADEQLELQKFIALESTMRALKAKALTAKSSRRT